MVAEGTILVGKLVGKAIADVMVTEGTPSIMVVVAPANTAEAVGASPLVAVCCVLINNEVDSQAFTLVMSFQKHSQLCSFGEKEARLTCYCWELW